MAIEIQLLAGAVILGIVHILLGAQLSTMQRGAKWNVGNRDGNTPELKGVAARADRALNNFKESFPLFVGAVLAVVAANKLGGRSELGAHLYLWARVAYLPVYLIGIPVVRSLIWLVSIAGIILVLSGLFG